MDQSTSIVHANFDANPEWDLSGEQGLSRQKSNHHVLWSRSQRDKYRTLDSRAVSLCLNGQSGSQRLCDGQITHDSGICLVDSLPANLAILSHLCTTVKRHLRAHVCSTRVKRQLHPHGHSLDPRLWILCILYRQLWGLALRPFVYVLVRSLAWYNHVMCIFVSEIKKALPPYSSSNILLSV